MNRPEAERELMAYVDELAAANGFRREEIISAMRAKAPHTAIVQQVLEDREIEGRTA